MAFLQRQRMHYPLRKPLFFRLHTSLKSSFCLRDQATPRFHPTAQTAEPNPYYLHIRYYALNYLPGTAGKCLFFVENPEQQACKQTRRLQTEEALQQPLAIHLQMASFLAIEQVVLYSSPGIGSHYDQQAPSNS